MSLRLIESEGESKSQTQKGDLLETLRSLLEDSLRLRNRGALATQLSCAQGCADGYMRALLDAGLVSESQLLQLVQDVRRGSNGPATKQVTVRQLQDLEQLSGTAAVS